MDMDLNIEGHYDGDDRQGVGLAILTSYSPDSSGVIYGISRYTI